jgi:hypothetical protein
MNANELSGKVKEFYGLGPKKDGWTANAAKHLVMDFKFDQQKGELTFSYPKKTDLEVSGFEAALGSVLGLKAREERPIEGNPWDIVMNYQGYVFLELSPTKNWQYHPREPGLSLKQEKHQHYFDTLYIDRATGNVTPVPFAGCRLLAFSVDRKADTPKHGFNVHVQFADPFKPQPNVARNVMDVIFDPDIKNDANATDLAEPAGFLLGDEGESA